MTDFRKSAEPGHRFWPRLLLPRLAGAVTTPVGVASAAIFFTALGLTLLTLGAGSPPGIDTPGHLFKAWEIARGAERDLFSLHGWTQNWYNGHPLYYYYPPASYFVLGAFDYVVDNIEISYRLFLFASLIAGGAAAYLFARRWLDPLTAGLAAVGYQLAPYTLKMMFWEGNIPRAMTFGLVPLVFLFAVRAVETGNRKHFSLLAVTVALLVYTHQMPAATTLVLLAIFMVAYALGRLSAGRLMALGVYVVLGVGLSAVWLIPAVTQSDLPDVPNLTALPERLNSYSTTARILLDPRAHLDDPANVNGYIGVAAVVLGLFALWHARLGAGGADSGGCLPVAWGQLANH